MATLSAGSYGLSQQQQQHQHSPNGNDNKELISVKLTDSALRAIEEFQRNQLKFGNNPSIQFLANGDGCLCFPSSGSNVQKFIFSITDTESGGSLECIQQNQGQQLQNLGHIPHKMRIHAKDDVYETTRSRMAAAEENQKNKCTREIKPNQTDIGRRAKLKNPITRINNIPSNNSVLSKRDPLHSSNNNYSGLNNGTNNSSTNSSILNNSNLSSAVSALANNNHHNHLLSSTNNNISGNTYNNLKTSPKLAKSNGLQQHNNHHNNSPKQQQQQQQQQLNNVGGTESDIVQSRTVKRKASNPELMKRNIRERLIHLLAVRPYKKPELYVRIHQEGVRDQEKNCIPQVLRNISNMRDNVYYLFRHIWNDVQEDWPFYSEQERQSMKRRKPQNLTPPLSSDGGSSTSGHSPSSAHNGSSPPSGCKRPSLPSNNDDSTNIGSMPTSKKPRISHYKKDVHSDINRSNVTPNAQESEDSGVSLSYSLVSNDVARRIQNPTGDVLDVMTERDNYDEQITAYREDAKEDNTLKDDFSDQFTRITSVEQRRKYKTEFDNDFQEYRRLHEIVEQVSRKFAQLEENLQHERHNEKRYKEIQRQIIKEYDESIKDTRFQQTKQRFNYLHNKLSHIKHLVHDYDVAITNGLCRPQENY